LRRGAAALEGAAPADGPKSTPVAGNHRAPKAFQHTVQCVHEARLTRVGGGTPARLSTNAG